MILIKHFKYLSYIVRYKWFVLIAGINIKVPLGQLLMHDISKFRPSEWFAYVDAFYGQYGYAISNKIEANTEVVFGHEIDENRVVMNKFDLAWLMHQHRNPHHWQYWVLREDSGKIKK